MKIVSKKFITNYGKKIINIHPSLLPKFKGLNTFQRAIKNNEKKTGCTVHFVDEKLDNGKTIIQKSFFINKNDGVKILKEWSPNVMYLSTTDYIQHKFAPNQQGAKDFYSMADAYIGELDHLGAALVVTADHGMKPKHNANGEPSVVYVQDLLDQWLGEAKARVILPITDPYVVHHGALGSFATAYLDRKSVV